MKRVLQPRCPSVAPSNGLKNVSTREESAGIVLYPCDPHFKYMENNRTLCHKSLFKISEKNP